MNKTKPKTKTKKFVEAEPDKSDSKSVEYISSDIDIDESLSEKYSAESVDEPNTYMINYGNTIQKIALEWAPAFKILLLACIFILAVGCRVFSVIRYESIIHEFDPWFNFRATKILTDKGYYDFKYWIDSEAWYPLGRYSGHTLFPGLM